MSMNLQPIDRAAYQRHVLSLDAADRRLRFGTTWNDAAIVTYIGRIDPTVDALLAVVAPDGFVAGALHLAHGFGYAEAGLSVAPDHRRQGIGGRLLDAAITRSRDWGVAELFVHGSAENAAMIRLARSRHMMIVLEAGELDAFLPIRSWAPTAHRAVALA